MAKVVMLKHKESGLRKKGFYGFSWTYLFFGFLVPVVRGEVGIALIHFIISLMTCFISNIVFSFVYNKSYTSRLLERGYVFDDNKKVVDEAKSHLE